MKFARTIRLDVSDTQVFEHPAEPGEWAVAGTFEFLHREFAGGDPATWSRKRQLAFKSGWLGLSGFGRATFVQVAVVPDARVEEAERALAAHLFERYGAPDMLTALDAARRECRDMADLCDHPAGTLLAIEREFTEDGVAERVRVIPAAGDGQHARIWGVAEDE
ncbi:MAG: hypothetical protein COW30_03785 [Rhodospirillales bacterium CG15_BIG_FIL_POST_REV_8_21_14_020_66_15]|nr:MAG: hypothetical protein COW30_03785 [Rhodospirillales bacterium CG15_BIG_FIL_POST_REV_8_21_14_020_66_15]